MASALIALTAWGTSYDGEVDRVPAPGNLAVIRHLIHYSFGGSTTRPQGRPVQLSSEGLQPGDVVLASRSGSSYGHFTHVTAMLDDRMVLGHNVLFGIFALELKELSDYDHVVVKRAALSLVQRAEVSRFLFRLEGSVFNLLAHKRDPRLWQCSKSIWAAFKRVGIDLVPSRDFILPDDIAASPALHTVREWGKP